MNHRVLALPLFALLQAAGCDESDAVSVRVRLKPDMSGNLTVSSLVLPVEAGAGEKATQGVEFGGRANLVCAGGTFAELGKVVVDDLTFTSASDADGSCRVRVSIPRGPSARWPKSLTVPAPDDRRRAVVAFDPDGKANKVGATLKIEIQLPKPVVSSGVVPKLKGVELVDEGRTATLTIPVERGTEEGDPMVWHLTWVR
jgi:hypothetical protein